MKTLALNLSLVALFLMTGNPAAQAAGDRMAEGGFGSAEFLEIDTTAEPKEEVMTPMIQPTAAEVMGTQSTKAPEAKMPKGPVIPIAGYSRGQLEGDNPPRCRKHPLLKRWKTHAGCDMGTAQGRSIVSTLPGKVVTSRNVGGYGNFIVIKHKLPDGKVVYSRYGHLFKNSKSCKMAPVGKVVAAGDKVGCVGSTGLSSGPHLHFELRSSADGGVIYDSKYFVLSGGKLRKAPVCG